MEIDTEKYLARFRVFNPTSLFPPDFSLLKKGKCPLCARKLYWRADGKFGYCKSVKKDGFKISSKIFKRLSV